MIKPRKNYPTIDDVAEKAGVSISTVSRVINRTVPVSEEIAIRVQQVMQELNYVPRVAARNLATNKTNTIGLLLTDIGGDFFAPLLSGIESVAGEAGYDLLISTAGRRGPHTTLPPSLGKHNSDGLLVFTQALTDSALSQATHNGLPLVLIHQRPPADVPIPCVTIENKAASAALVSHLITTHQRQNILFLRGTPQHEDAYWREMGYRQALAQHGLPLNPLLIAAGDFNREVAYYSVLELLASGVYFDAVFAGDDEAAVGVFQALHTAGVKIPQEVAVVGFDNQRFAELLTPSLTTIHAPTEQVGAEAAQQLLHLIHGRPTTPLTLLPTQLIIRHSCGC